MDCGGKEVADAVYRGRIKDLVRGRPPLLAKHTCSVQKEVEEASEEEKRKEQSKCSQIDFSPSGAKNDCFFHFVSINLQNIEEFQNIKHFLDQLHVKA